MDRRPVSSRVVLVLLGVAIVLPIGITVVLAVAAILIGMGDTLAGQVLQRIGLGIGILWGVDLVCLVLAHSLNSLSDPPGAP